MGQPAARLTDMHSCPMVTGIVPHVGGPILAPGAPTVLTGKLPQARVTDQCVCVGPPDVIVKGSTGVLVSKLPAARMGDNTAHGGVIVLGLFTVLIGETGGGGGGGGGGGSVWTASGAARSSAAGSPGSGATGANMASRYTPIPGLDSGASLSGLHTQAAAMKKAAGARDPFVDRCTG